MAAAVVYRRRGPKRKAERVEIEEGTFTELELRRTDFECEKGCGFTGTYDVVAQHETRCGYCGKSASELSLPEPPDRAESAYL